MKPNVDLWLVISHTNIAVPYCALNCSKHYLYLDVYLHYGYRLNINKNSPIPINIFAKFMVSLAKNRCWAFKSSFLVLKKSHRSYWIPFYTSTRICSDFLYVFSFLSFSWKPVVCIFRDFCTLFSLLFDFIFCKILAYRFP